MQTQYSTTTPPVPQPNTDAPGSSLLAPAFHPEPFRDRRLSFAARGLFALLLTEAEPVQLLEAFPGAGPKIDPLLLELERAGYVHFVAANNGDCTIVASTIPPKQGSGEPLTGEPQ